MLTKTIQRFLLVLILPALFFLCPSVGWAQTNPFESDSTVVSETGTTGSSADTHPKAILAIDKTWVNVRSGPSTKYKVLGTFERGTKGKKIGEKNGWYHIQFDNGTKGWVRGDLVAEQKPAPLPIPKPDEKETLNQEFAKWDRLLGDDLLNFKRFPWWWRLSWARRAFAKGDFKNAYLSAQKSSVNPLESQYMMAKALNGLGKFAESRKILDSIKKVLEDRAMEKIMDSIAKPYIKEPVVFKFGGFDTIDQYKDKKSSGTRLGLESKEYYEKYVNIKTWKWRSKAAQKDFAKIGGLDCSGFVQQLQKSAFEKAGVKYPIKGRTSTRGLWGKKYTDEINPGVKPPPPPDIRPGDMILIDYGHNRFGHSVIYRGKDEHGNIRVLQMGDTAQEGILPASKFKHYKGTFRMKGMDKVRETLLS